MKHQQLNHIHLLFYCPDISENISEHEISGSEFRHIMKSMRKKTGDTLFITDGKGRLFKTVILKTQKHSLTVKILESVFTEKSRKSIWLAMGIIRPQLLEMVVEKATELGVQKILPFRSRYVERQIFKQERLEKIAATAIKQSLQLHLPQIESPLSLHELLDLCQAIPDENRLLAKDSNSPSIISEISFKTNSPILMVIGPEGGFADEEFRLFSENRFKAVRLANTRLRAETAAIVSMAQLQLSVK